ncbi:MAG: hypothetical protein HOE30_08855 [Deltaproteobacteria bacterium]|jgi:hypothetical protein|nr:hypothetical protein [Deltaproteobacteria bacterium]
MKKGGGKVLTDGYTRIHTDKQETGSQRHRINKFTAKADKRVDSWIEEATRKQDPEFAVNSTNYL